MQLELWQDFYLPILEDIRPWLQKHSRLKAHLSPYIMMVRTTHAHFQDLHAPSTIYLVAISAGGRVGGSRLVGGIAGRR